MHKANEMAIRVVSDYCVRLTRQRRPHWRSPEFAQLSYSKTAAHEILDALKQNDSIPPLQTIEEYRDKVDKYSCINPKTSIMFSAAHDVAEDIINELIKAYY